MKRSHKIIITIIILILAGFILISIPERQKSIRTEHFSLRYSSSIDSTKIRKLSDALERSYWRIGNDLKTGPAPAIETIIYAQRWRYVKATKNWGGSGNIEGISKLHFVEQAWGEPDTEKVAVHEFAHTVTLKFLLDQEPQPINSAEFDKKFARFPAWLWEAISVYEAGQFVDPRTLPYLANGQHPDLAELNTRLKGGKIYACGYTLMEYMLITYGQDKFLELIKNYGDIKTTFNVSPEQFCTDWYAFVSSKYLNQADVSSKADYHRLVNEK